MSQTFPVSVAAFPFRCAGATPVAISLDPIASISAPSGPLLRSERATKSLLHSPDLTCCRQAGEVVLASRRTIPDRRWHQSP